MENINAHFRVNPFKFNDSREFASSTSFKLDNFKEVVAMYNNKFYFYDILLYLNHLSINNQQLNVLNHIENGRINIIVKSRQSGSTIILLSKILYSFFFENDKKINYVNFNYNSCIEAYRIFNNLMDSIIGKYKFPSEIKEKNILSITSCNNVVINFCHKDNITYDADEWYFDEYAFMEDIVKKEENIKKLIFFIDNIISNHNTKDKMTFTSTPNGINNHFYEMFTKASKSPSNNKITIDDNTSINLLNNSYDENILDEKWAQDRLKKLGIISFSEEYLGKFISK